MIDKQNPIVLAEKIAYLIDHPALCQSIGEAGRKKFKEEFTLERFENRMKEILIQILNY